MRTFAQARAEEEGFRVGSRVVLTSDVSFGGRVWRRGTTLRVLCLPCWLDSDFMIAVPDERQRFIHVSGGDIALARPSGRVPLVKRSPT